MAASKQGASAMASGLSNSADREIFETRVYDAPRELVWNLWTDPERISKWWGPRGFTTTTSKMDLRPGGVWLHVMHGPDGRDYPNKVVYAEVVKPQRIVYDHESYPPFRVTATFDALEEKTRVSMRMVFETAELRNKAAEEFGAVPGLQQTLERFEEELVKSPLVIERTYRAPIETVWRAITEVDQLKQWFMREINSFRPELGFETEFTVRNRDKDFPHIWKVLDVVPGRKIAVEWKFAGYSGSSVATMELFEESDGTKLRLTHEGLENYPREATDLAKKNFAMGWNALIHQQLPNFLQKVQTIRELVLTREYDVPRDLVFKAWADPEQMAKWWGPRGFTNPVCQMDVRPGGKIRIDMHGPDGTDYPMTGRFDEVVAPERLVFTCWAHCDASGKAQVEVINSVTFVDQNGKTKMKLHARVIKATREAATALAGMDQGWAESLVRLAELISQSEAR